MGTHFTLIKHTGRDIKNLGNKLTENQVRKILLRADDESCFQVREWNDDFFDLDGTPRLLDFINGEEWLDKYL